jgi:Ala-tRNA(Pro) deacylase
MLATRLKEFLRKNNVNFETIVHPNVYTAQGVAAATHTPGKEFAKTVILNVDGAFAMAVLPAADVVDLALLEKDLGAAKVRMADEGEFASLFPDCEVGAMPPFGPLYNLPVYADETLAEDDWIVFNAGSHREAIRMAFQDFKRLVDPKLMKFRAPRRKVHAA